MTSKINELSELADCVVCPRECRANRVVSPTGWCKSGAGFSISSICIHRGEEPPVSGEDGICNIFFTNCNLQCIYCQNWQISDNRLEHGQEAMDFDEVIARVTAILDRGIKRVGFVSPSHFIPQMLAVIGETEARGYKPVWVYNSNGYDKVGTLKRLEGIIDVYLPDVKYMNAPLAEAYSGGPDYPVVVTAALNEMYRQKGAVLHLAEDGTVESGIIIRHLVLPGETGNSIQVLRFIATELSPGMHVSLMSQYYPTPSVSCHPKLNRSVTAKEYLTVAGELDRLGMHNGWIQEMESHQNYRPDFRHDHPFENGEQTRF